ncbi:DUF7146 domain-containing protein [Rhizobium skierniewicense]|uniref:DUF7146 domain-containing protein n=1 Tax=Rhizobium skierniewicense TaxID=984260 RepID=UPI0015744650|nr:hypothetical protein [Rhizobium skierniewicense]NTF32320.1 hypothetical protein [Rhizobium skierniewicense]
MTNLALDEFIERARNVTVSEAADRLGIKLGRNEYTAACPRCGGTDRFSINGTKNVFNCRNCGGGRDGIALMAHFHNLDLRDGAGFLEACAAVLGEDIPEGGERETDAQRHDRLDRIAALKAENERKNKNKEADENRYRDIEVGRARGIYDNALDLRRNVSGLHVELFDYLRLRTGFQMHFGILDHIRFAPNHSYWHGTDEMGRKASPWQGPAMIAPFVSPSNIITGCHETWIDLSTGSDGKYRPDLGCDAKGEPLATKKMRGTKKGSLIPLFGSFTAMRWVLGEGIETVLAYAGAEGWRADTFYGASGDLGNLAGPADPSSAFAHPTMKGGNGQFKKIQGPVPKPDQSPEDAVQVPARVEDLIILVDGDSELVFTAAAITRACARFEAAHRVVTPFWPPEGEDFASLFAKLHQGENV